MRRDVLLQRRTAGRAIRQIECQDPRLASQCADLVGDRLDRFRGSPVVQRDVKAVGRQAQRDGAADPRLAPVTEPFRSSFILLLRAAASARALHRHAQRSRVPKLQLAAGHRHWNLYGVSARAAPSGACIVNVVDELQTRVVFEQPGGDAQPVPRRNACR
jgi:hypothetical protein